MTKLKQPERLSELLKFPSQNRTALDVLEYELGKDMVTLRKTWGMSDTTIPDREVLAEWCLANLNEQEMLLLRQALRLAANQQRVHKRTIVLTPSAHLLVKFLSDKENLIISEVIEFYLLPVLRDQYGLNIRTVLNIDTGQVEHLLVDG